MEKWNGMFVILFLFSRNVLQWGMMTVAKIRRVSKAACEGLVKHFNTKLAKARARGEEEASTEEEDEDEDEEDEEEEDAIEGFILKVAPKVGCNAGCVLFLVFWLGREKLMSAIFSRNFSQICQKASNVICPPPIWLRSPLNNNGGSQEEVHAIRQKFGKLLFSSPHLLLKKIFLGPQFRVSSKRFFCPPQGVEEKTSCR